jgi:hypothetical protein
MSQLCVLFLIQLLDFVLAAANSAVKAVSDKRNFQHILMLILLPDPG